MMMKLLVAIFAVGASAYVPAMPGSALAQSKIASRPQYTAPTPVVARSSNVEMSAVTERDADGNPVTHFEMFDAIWLVVVLLPYTALLVTNPW